MLITQPFLTDLDTRAGVKGSVDPLGAMAIWTRLGRHVVGNLSTVTSSVKDFKTLVLGFALLRDLRRQAGADEDVDDLAAFLRWEQLAAYTRAGRNDWTFRGTRRVKLRLSDGRGVPVSAERDCQILGNQKIYGLWGLFTVPARSSGLLEKETNVLTQTAEEFVDQGWKRALKPVWGSLLDTVGKNNRRFKLDSQEALLKRLRQVWRPSAQERSFWEHHLVNGGPADRTTGRQAVLAGLLRATLGDTTFTYSQKTVRTLAQKAQAKDEQLAEYLRDIAACESVLALADRLFGYVQTLDAQPLKTAPDAIRRMWPRQLKQIDVGRFSALRGELTAATGNERLASEWLTLSEELSRGQWADVVASLLRVNKLVMESRGGAAWVVEDGQTFRVRYRDEGATLPLANELDGLWRYPYFVDSLRSVVRELEAA